MASSDDEGETVPNNVSDYEFVSGNNESVSFAELPLEWDKGQTPDGKKPQQIFLRGKTDNGLQKIYKQVIAWKFDLSYKKLEISVLSAEGYWIKLLKPWKPFHEIIRTIQVTLHLLHFVRWNPQRSRKALWDHLDRTFSMFDRRPCEDDLADHVPLITEAGQRDERLANSKLLSTLLAEKPWMRKTFDEGVKPPFIVDANEIEDQGETHENGDDELAEDDCFDYVCTFCDNGGHLTICDGKCMRSFHATVEDGEESRCESLGFTDAEVEAIQNVAFYCENCQYKKHQCFACGELGSSDESSSPEVFCCVNGACGFFYHPHCVAKLLHPRDSAAAKELQQRIAAGEPFACPAHRCHVCNELEVRSIDDLQFAVCRRCPRAYHRKCLPREITFEKDVDMERGIVQRAWTGLIPNRILIYCLDHEINPNILTPVRDHIKFPGPRREKKKMLPLESAKNKNLLNQRGLSLEDNARNRISAKPLKGIDKVSSSSMLGDLSRKRVEKFPLQASSKKQKVAINRNSLGKSRESTTDEGEISLGDKLYNTFFGMNSEPVNSSSGEVVRGGHEIIQKVKPATKRIDNPLTLDADARKRILALMKDASSSVTLDQVKKRHRSPSTHSQYSKFSAENVTLGKVEGSIQAVRAALKKLDEGGSVQDAKAVCGNDLLVQVLRWKEKLKVYLAPFLHGMRYTSFGRHFTKTDKLKEIVDMLHCYVQDGDMLVDFCCGSNDFSCLMKRKLNETGKRCSFKNYDILQAKNDFNFERRDWMEVRKDELPDGSQLIMGLNPPFGVNAALANKFIDKALEFKPKLLILIVPRETMRLDKKKKSPYDLIWEDDQMFVGKSFYLPGSVDVNDKQIDDWNVNAPVLYLWSSPHWTPKHKAIAEQHSHPSRGLKNYRLDESHNEMDAPNSEQECHKLDKSVGDQVEEMHLDAPENLEPNNRVTTSHQEGLPCDINGSEEGKNNAPAKNNSESVSKNSIGKRKKKRQPSNMPREARSSSKLSVPCRLSPSMADHAETHSPIHLETLSRAPSERGDYQQFNKRNFPVYQPYSQTGYDGNQPVDDLVKKYSLNGEESCRSMPSRQAYGPSPNPDYGLRASADRFMGFPEGRAHNFAYGSNVGDYDRDATIQSHVDVLGREDPNSWIQGTARPSYPGTGFPTPYRQLNPAANSTFVGMNTSAMQRYAPRLHELNHARMNDFASGPPLQGTSGVYHPSDQRPAFQGSLGFAPDPYRTYSQQNSSGWLNE